MRKRKEKPPSKNTVRLAVCAWLLFAAFICRFMFCESTESLFSKVNEIIGGSVDYEAAISTIGMAVSGEIPASTAVKDALIYAFVIDSGEIEAFYPQEKETNEKTQEPDTEDELTVPNNVTMDYTELSISYTDPVKGAVLRPFGYYMSDTMETDFNYGCDIKTEDSAEVVSFSDGHVYAVGSSTIYGEYIIILHDGAKTLYSNLKDICIASGEDVVIGQSIGKTNGDILHFELMTEGFYVNPEYYLYNEG